MSASETRRSATIAALNWVGVYEAEPTREDDRERYGWSVSLSDAFEDCGTAARVKARFPGFPADMVDAYAMLRRMYLGQRNAGVAS